MAALGWLTPRRRPATARSVLAGEAAAEAARKSTLPADESAPTEDTAALPDDTAAPAVAEETAEPAFPVAGDDRAAAFFDLDNTVMQGAALFHFGRGLYKRKFFQRRELTRFAWQQAWFRLAGVEDPEHMQDARDSALSIVKGHRVSELMSIGEEIYDEYMADRIWPGTRALAQAHLDAGQKVWLVTAAPVETATIIARRLGLTGALGTVAESVDGVYTGRLVGEPLHGPAKAEAVRALAVAEGLDLERCAAYSDSHNDIPMLSLVGHPYAINPDAKLRKHARALDWRLRDYRTGRKAAGMPTLAALRPV
ncbi:HAD family hydrolase, partial [Streptomyces griseolus]|uniref:HAD family hydrolase n=1 Tax=Streptomyces griseolus TaxID=1909 RepID=UPI00224307F0